MVEHSGCKSVTLSVAAEPQPQPGPGCISARSPEHACRPAHAWGRQGHSLQPACPCRKLLSSLCYSLAPCAVQHRSERQIQVLQAAHSAAAVQAGILHSHDCRGIVGRSFPSNASPPSRSKSTVCCLTAPLLLMHINTERFFCWGPHHLKRLTVIVSRGLSQNSDTQRLIHSPLR